MLAVGNDFVVACLSDGKLLAWGGQNQYGQLNIPEDIGSPKHVSAGNGFVVATMEDGTVVAWGKNDKGQATPPSGLTDVAYTVCGADFVYAIKTDGSVVTWGSTQLIPEDVVSKGVKYISVGASTIAIETTQSSITTFDVNS